MINGIVKYAQLIQKERGKKNKKIRKKNKMEAMIVSYKKTDKPKIIVGELTTSFSIIYRICRRKMLIRV